MFSTCFFHLKSSQWCTMHKRSYTEFLLSVLWFHSLFGIYVYGTDLKMRKVYRSVANFTVHGLSMLHGVCISLCGHKYLHIHVALLHIKV